MEVYGGFTNHQAVDFAIPKGTPVLAAADGLAVASFDEAPIEYPPGIIRTWQGRPVTWGYGLYIWIVHPSGWRTVYGHLHKLAPAFEKARAYYPPEVTKTAVNSTTRQFDPKDFGKKVKALPVKAGQVIGLSGITGMGIGQRTYENWLAGKPYEANDEEHVHFEVVNPDRQNVDPFGIYALSGKYPPMGADWSELPKSLWLE